MQTSAKAQQEFVAKMNEEAVQLMRQRILPSRIATQLVEQGLDQATADSIVFRLSRRAALNRRTYNTWSSAKHVAGYIAAALGCALLVVLIFLPEKARNKTLGNVLQVFGASSTAFVSSWLKCRSMRAGMGEQSVGLPK
jgi:hypothetical protein